MSRQHQSSRLPAVRQGEEGYETTTKLFHLVRIDSVSHTIDFHLADTKIALRNSLQRWKQGGGGFHGLRIR
ncbi:hypothetical protein DFO55_1406 [Grimontella sp. AG753]|nr:hypothetical protein DFO55_1406 [Grimontella sp. AG753]